MFQTKSSALGQMAVCACALLFAASAYSAEEPGSQPASAPKAPEAARPSANPIVELKTSLGVIEIELLQDKAPLSVENFVAYVSAGHYNGTLFHRVMPDFMIQGGGFAADFKQKPTKAPIKNEAANGLKNERGTVAMARTSAVDSATAEFFINVKDNAFLDHGVRDYGYAVFGKVVKGMDVADKIRMVKTATRSGMENVPVEPVVIESAKVKGKDEAPKAPESRPAEK